MRFPEFTGEWKAEPLNDIAKLTKGVGISKDQLSESGEPCILYGELYTKYKSEIIKEIISKTDIPTEKLMRSKANDVIIPCSGETAVDIATARCVLLDNVLLGGDLNIIRLPHHDGSFMSYQLNGKRKCNIARVAQGVSVVHLYGDHLKEVLTYNPKLEEQKKIVRLLALLDERIATQSKIIEAYQSLIRAITDKTIIDLLNGTIVNFEQFYDEAGEGGTPSTSNAEFYYGGTIPFIKIADLSEKYLRRNKDFITEKGLNKSSAWIIPSNSVIYSNGATIGAISVNTYPVATKQGILGIVPSDSVSTEYLYYLMSSTYFRKEVERIITEGTMKTAYLKDINGIQCPLPSRIIQDRISTFLSLISSIVEVEHAVLEEYNKAKSYLLNKLFI